MKTITGKYAENTKKGSRIQKYEEVMSGKLFLLCYIVDALGRGDGTQLGQLLIVISVYTLPQRTQKPESAGKKCFW